jgi:hypothetical protein
MQKTYSEHDSQEYTFDPSSIVKIISENPQIGLALIQLPISIANSLMRSHNNLKWKDNPTKPGYYWVKSSNETISIKEYSSKDINYIIDTSLKSLLKFYGPLEPPE